jgi:hypothetical protein
MQVLNGEVAVTLDETAPEAVSVAAPGVTGA